MTEKSYLDVTDENGVTVVAFKQPTMLDADHVSQVGEQLYRLIEKEHRHQIVLDLASIKMLSSRTLGVFLNMRKKLEQLHGKMVISGIDPSLYRVFKITKLDSLFQFCDNKSSAVNTLLDR